MLRKALIRSNATIPSPIHQKHIVHIGCTGGVYGSVPALLKNANPNRGKLKLYKIQLNAVLTFIPPF